MSDIPKQSSALDNEEVMVRVKCTRCVDTGVDPDPEAVCCGRSRDGCCGSPDMAPQPCKKCSNPPAGVTIDWNQSTVFEVTLDRDLPLGVEVDENTGLLRAADGPKLTWSEKDAQAEQSCGGYYSTLARGGK